MFVDAQKHLTELKEKRRRLYKETAVSVITDLVTVMDNKFADLERRYVTKCLMILINMFY